MSPNVGNFVHDLVEMAKAMEELPGVRDDLTKANEYIMTLRETVQSREEAILRYKAEIETLQAKVRTTEAERDDAEIRFLELDEKTHQVMGMLIDFEGKAKGARLILDPPKPEPVPEPEVKPEPVYTGSGFEAQGHESTVIMPETASGQSDENPPINDGSPTSQAKDDTSSGQGEADPIVATVNTGLEVGAQDTIVTSTGNASTGSSSGPYSGLRYYDHPTYVPFSQWIEGGGSEEDYHWRPNYQDQNKA